MDCHYARSVQRQKVPTFIIKRVGENTTLMRIHGLQLAEDAMTRFMRTQPGLEKRDIC